MTQHRLQAGASTLVANCSLALHRQADWLLAALKNLADLGNPLADRTRIQVGWSVLTLRQNGSELAVCEPDFAGNPLANVVEDVTRTLLVLAQQRDVLRRLGQPGQFAMFQDKVVLAAGCLERPQVYLERSKTISRTDSGWYIGPVEDAGPVKYEARYVFQLLDLRPALLQVMALPPGFVAVFEGDAITAVLNEAGEDVWARAAS
jgi:hypothetical protein